MINTASMVVLNERKMRHPQTTDKLHVQTVPGDARAYTVVNFGHFPTSRNTVRFSQSKDGQRIGCCTCKDFQQITKHGMQCKHLRVSAPVHLARNKAKALAARAATLSAFAAR